jgi:hypothetical protein
MLKSGDEVFEIQKRAFAKASLLRFAVLAGLLKIGKAYV